MRFYHGIATRSTRPRPLSLFWLGLVLQSTACFAANESVVTTRPATGVVEGLIRTGILDLFAHPDRMLEVFPVQLSKTDEERTRYALNRLFKPCRVEELALSGVTAKGRVDRIMIRVRNVDVFGLRVDAMTLELRGAKIDPDELVRDKRLKGQGQADVALSVTARDEDLTRASRDFKVEIRPGDFVLSGKAGVLFIRAGYRLHGTLLATPKNQLVFHPRSLVYGIVPVPRPVFAPVVRRVNPIFDMARFLGPAKSTLDIAFRTVRLDNHEMVVWLDGKVQSQASPKRRESVDLRRD